MDFMVPGVGYTPDPGAGENEIRGYIMFKRHVVADLIPGKKKTISDLSVVLKRKGVEKFGIDADGIKDFEIVEKLSGHVKSPNIVYFMDSKIDGLEGVLKTLDGFEFVVAVSRESKWDELREWEDWDNMFNWNMVLDNNALYLHVTRQHLSAKEYIIQMEETTEIDDSCSPDNAVERRYIGAGKMKIKAGDFLSDMKELSRTYNDDLRFDIMILNADKKTMRIHDKYNGFGWGVEGKISADKVKEIERVNVKNLNIKMNNTGREVRIINASDGFALIDHIIMNYTTYDDVCEIAMCFKATGLDWTETGWNPKIESAVKKRIKSLGFKIGELFHVYGSDMERYA